MNGGPNISSGLTLDRVIRFLIWAGVIGLAAWILWYFSDLVFYLVLGMVLAYILNPVVAWFQGLGLGRVSAIMITFVFMMAGIVFILASLIPFVTRQIVELSQLVSIESIRSIAAAIEEWLSGFVNIPPGTIIDSFSELFMTLFHQDVITTAVSSVVDVFANIFYAVIIVPFVTFFFLKDGPSIREWVFSLVPNRYFEMCIGVVEKVEMNIGKYFRGLFIQCVSVAIVATILLWIVGLRNAAAVGIFAGIANTIPYFGPFVGFIAGTVVGIAQTGDFSLVPGVLIAMVLTQLSDNIFFQPFIFSRAARTHPLVILVVVLIGAKLGGIIGMLIAIPLATIIRVSVAQVLWSLRNFHIFRVAS